MAFVNEKYNGQWRTIDRDRDAILILQPRTGGEGPDEILFIVKNQPIRIEAWDGARVNNKKFDVEWEIVRISGLEFMDREELLNLLTEALKAHGRRYHPEKANFVNVKFNLKN